MARANEAVNEAVCGICVVRSFNTEKHESQRYDGRLMDIEVLKTRQGIVKAVCLLAQRVRRLWVLFVCFFLWWAKLCVSIADGLI